MEFLEESPIVDIHAPIDGVSLSFVVQNITASPGPDDSSRFREEEGGIIMARLVCFKRGCI